DVAFTPAVSPVLVNVPLAPNPSFAIAERNTVGVEASVPKNIYKTSFPAPTSNAPDLETEPIFTVGVAEALFSTIRTVPAGIVLPVLLDHVIEPSPPLNAPPPPIGFPFHSLSWK